jgi:apolipoprotein N-acyltransferase
MRVARAEALRRRAEQTAGLRRAVSLLVPGAAGLLANRPFQAWLACTTAAAALATLAAARGVVPDPLAAGAAGPALFGAAALVAVLAYLLLLGAGLAAQRAD